MELKIRDQLSGKRVLFITTKNLDYIRNSQELALCEEAVHVDVIGSLNRNYFFRIMLVYLKLLFFNIQNIDVIFVGFSPQLILPLFWRKFRKKYVIEDFFISLYDTFVDDRKKIKDGSWVANLLHKIDEITVKKASMIIADTKAHAAYFINEFGAEQEKLKVLYIEADKRIYYPRKVKKPTKLKDKYVVLYFGSVLPLQGVDIVLKAFEKLQNDSNLYFYMIGRIHNKYEKPQSDNIEYIDWLPQEQLAEYIAIADLCIAGHFNPQIGKADRTIPGKGMIYKAMGKRMILGDSTANREMFEEGPYVSFVTMGNADLLAQKIVDSREKYGQN